MALDLRIQRDKWSPSFLNKLLLQNSKELIDLLIVAYLHEPGHSNRVICDYTKPQPTGGKVCNVDVLSSHWGPCTNKSQYGFPTSSPCIFLKLNRVSICGLLNDFIIELVHRLPDDCLTIKRSFYYKHHWVYLS